MGSSFCTYFNQNLCRSCGWIDQEYGLQIQAKERRIREALAFFPAFELAPPVLSPLQGFRNRAKMAVTGSLEHPVIGLVGQESLDQGRELLNCPIHHPRLNELMGALPEMIRANGLEPYRINQRQGELKGLIAFYSPLSDQMYLRFVVRSKDSIVKIRKGLPALQARFPSLVCISANIQPIAHAILEGPEEVLLTERTSIEHLCGSVRLQLTPQAFVQTNASVAAELYRVAAEWIAEARPAKMLDLFCGQGAFGLAAAASCPEILGIEINPEAVQAAGVSAQLAGHGHLKFLAADATRVDAEIRVFEPELVLVNPPRRGLSSQGVALLRANPPKHLIYSSCSVGTLASDFQAMVDFYPRIERVQLFDMFPHTEHFETLVWLRRK